MNGLRVALCGNPNVGKSTVFNALTGLRQHTGNWAGKTVESARGQVRDPSGDWTLIDLPGAYSLLNGSPEEVVASDYLNFSDVDAAIVVCDATCLERNLNLALQVAEACPRTVICVNMMDEAEKRGITLDIACMEATLQMPVVGVTAKRKLGLKDLKRRVVETARGEKHCPDCVSCSQCSYCSKAARLHYPCEVEDALQALTPVVQQALPRARTPHAARFAALRLLVGGEGFLQRLLEEAEAGRRGELAKAAKTAIRALESKGFVNEKLIGEIIGEGYRAAGELCRVAVDRPVRSLAQQRQLRIDRLLSGKRVGIPLMLCLLLLVLYITITGANVPSAWLSETLLGFEQPLIDMLRSIRFPDWLMEMLVLGVYRVTVWVVSVMLPPMAIFFPLFTLLEDLGFLPRVAFNLDKCFQKCKACGKQALCICMGLGCNAVGVMGCRIIQSPRERLIAILTNAMTPCNGRFPTLILLMTTFFVTAQGALGSFLSAVALLGLIVLSVAVTFLCSRLLSQTVLKGIPSSFSLELPPFRRPRIGQVLVRSVLDRTLFVLGRAISVAAPAGLILWILANVHIGGVQVLQWVAGFLDPVGRFLGMDGVILLAFILGFPANEIVVPIILMTYLAQGTLIEPQGFDTLRMIFIENGWTIWTAACVALFSLFHWPCSTTVLTIYRETKSAKWTALAVVLPTLVGCVLCALVGFIGRLV